MKYRVTVRQSEVFDEGFEVVVRNQRGREWKRKKVDACPGNAAESAMVLEEFVNEGGKLDPEAWVEVSPTPFNTVAGYKLGPLAELI